MSASSRNTAPARAQQDDMTKIIEKHGSLFRLNDAAYRRLLTSMIAGTKYDLWELGRCIGCIHASLGSFDRDDAEFELARLDVRPSLPSSNFGAEQQPVNFIQAGEVKADARCRLICPGDVPVQRLNA